VIRGPQYQGRLLTAQRHLRNDRTAWIDVNGTDGNKDGNYIGTRADGQGPLANYYSGVSIQDGAEATRVGGSAAGEGNLISGNHDHGVYLSDPGTENNQVLGNIIGTNAQGDAILGQGMHGVIITRASQPDRTTAAPAGAICSAEFVLGRSGGGAESQGNRILGNHAGTNLAGAPPCRTAFMG
jgi:titin